MSLKTNGLSKRFGDKWVLRDVSFTAERGQLTGLFGPAGAGKTTALQLVCGLLTSNHRTVEFNGGAVRNDFTFFPAPGKAGFLARLIPGRSRSVPNSFEDLVSAVGNSKSLLVLDEPFLNLDWQERQQSVNAIRSRAKEKGLTVIIATNDFGHVLEACDAAAVLYDGEIHQQGSPQNIYDNPSTRKIALLSGRNNVLDARRLTSSKADIQEFQTIDGSHRVFAKRADLAVMGALNQNVALAIRPEQLSISFGASFPEDNLLKAVISEVKALGSHTLVALDADGLQMTASVPKLVGLAVGDECMVGLPPDRIQILSK